MQSGQRNMFYISYERLRLEHMIIKFIKRLNILRKDNYMMCLSFYIHMYNKQTCRQPNHMVTQMPLHLIYGCNVTIMRETLMPLMIFTKPSMCVASSFEKCFQKCWKTTHLKFLIPAGLETICDFSLFLSLFLLLPLSHSFTLSVSLSLWERETSGVVLLSCCALIEQAV